MVSVTRQVSTRELRAGVSEVIGRVMYGYERIGITRNGKLAAVMISVEDLEDLEAAEAYMDAYDVAEIEKAKAEDDGVTYSFEEVLARLEADQATNHTDQ
ncbi:MAG: type II toxin-antitoxin system Phd/YefM family antitoxin [Micrococcales bacterium]|nr:type II toxin-antitoxin system Phd/YefM family antitoxin [Micrococcales bacterium]